MLKLPPNFKNDIAGRDTALIPLVVIGNFDGDFSATAAETWVNGSTHISTNVFSNSGGYIVTGGTSGYYSFTTIPILLNIPSLKESINISTRKYSINSINLDISNFPHHGGERFSDSTGNTSLINTEVRIFWWSQSTGYLFPQDKLPEYPTDPNDLSDSRALQIFYGTIRRYTHDDEKVRLVVEDRSQATLHKDLPTAELGFGDDVPDKFKGKKIPIVVGHVDRSPLVRSISNGKWILQADSFKPQKIADNISDLYGIGNYDQLYIYADASYVSIIKATQFNINTNNIIELISLVTQDIEDPINIDNILDCYYYLKPQLFNIYKLNDGVGILEQVPNVDIFFDNDLSTSHTFNITTDQENSGTNDEIHWHLAVPVVPSEIEFLELLSYDIMINGLLIELPEIGFDSFSQDHGVDGNASIVEAGLGGLIAFGTHIDGTDLGGIADTADIIFESATYESGVFNQGYYINKTFEIIKGINNFHIVASRYHNPAAVTADFTETSNITIKDIMVRTKIKIEKVLKLGFYANVIGRATETSEDDDGNITITSHPTAPTAIAHILENELGQTGITAKGTYDWKYAFTVDSKIGSKKLLENIASASPYIPRFNNMGEFKFTEIPMNGQPVSPATVQTIREADCISYSFSRSKIESVFTKIVFKYNWDYAIGEFNDSVEADVTLLTTDIGEYDPKYYGFDEPVELVIDDDRGKYIRDETTAQKFADWYLMWSCNQKLKLKIKLPLSKGLHLEIGDFVDFGNELLGGIAPYGIDYTSNQQKVNSQDVYKNFLITSTSKTLEFCEIEAFQMHDLDIEYDISTEFEDLQLYPVIASSAWGAEPDGIPVEDVAAYFPELEYLYLLYNEFDERMIYMGPLGWYLITGRSFNIIAGSQYKISFREKTTTNLFQLLDD